MSIPGGWAGGGPDGLQGGIHVQGAQGMAASALEQHLRPGKEGKARGRGGEERRHHRCGPGPWGPDGGLPPSSALVSCPSLPHHQAHRTDIVAAPARRPCLTVCLPLPSVVCTPCPRVATHTASSLACSSPGPHIIPWGSPPLEHPLHLHVCRAALSFGHQLESLFLSPLKWHGSPCSLLLPIWTDGSQCSRMIVSASPRGPFPCLCLMLTL